MADWIADSLGDTLEPHEARHLASLMISTADGMLIQTFIDDGELVAGGRVVCAATAKALAAARKQPRPTPQP